MGDPGKLLLLEAFINVLKSQNLIDNVNKTGTYLKAELMKVEKEFPNLLNSTRGRGLFLATTACNNKLRDEIVAKLKQNGE